MKLVTLQPVEGAQKRVDIKVGKTIIGRGPLLECADKKVSRNHALLEVQENGDVFLTPTHVNPCFFLPNDSKGGFEVLKKDCPQRIRDGDSFSLLPNSFRYRVIISDVADYESGDKDDAAGIKKDATATGQGTSTSGLGGVGSNKKDSGTHSTEPALLNGEKKDRDRGERDRDKEIHGDQRTGAGHDSASAPLHDLTTTSPVVHGQPKDNGKPAPLKNGLSPARSRRSEKLAQERDKDFIREHSPRGGHTLKKSHLVIHADHSRTSASETAVADKVPDASNSLGSRSPKGDIERAKALPREIGKERKSGNDHQIFKGQKGVASDKVDEIVPSKDASNAKITPSVRSGRSGVLAGKGEKDKAESMANTPAVALNTNSTICNTPGTPTNANKSPLATKKILSDKSSSGKKDAAGRDAKESKPDPEKQSKLKNFDFDEEDDEPQTTTSTTKPTSMKNKQQQQQIQQ
ncbi:uncharacterized protein LOC111267008, partial [Varroa jacobsoni]